MLRRHLLSTGAALALGGLPLAAAGTAGAAGNRRGLLINNVRGVSIGPGSGGAGAPGVPGGAVSGPGAAGGAGGVGVGGAGGGSGGQGGAGVGGNGGGGGDSVSIGGAGGAGGSGTGAGGAFAGSILVQGLVVDRGTGALTIRGLIGGTTSGPSRTFRDRPFAATATLARGGAATCQVLVLIIGRVALDRPGLAVQPVPIVIAGGSIRGGGRLEGLLCALAGLAGSPSSAARSAELVRALNDLLGASRFTAALPG